MLMSVSNYMQWTSLKWYQINSWFLLMFYHFVKVVKHHSQNTTAKSVLYISFLPAGQLYYFEISPMWLFFGVPVLFPV